MTGTRGSRSTGQVSRGAWRHCHSHNHRHNQCHNHCHNHRHNHRHISLTKHVIIGVQIIVTSSFNSFIEYNCPHHYIHGHRQKWSYQKYHLVSHRRTIDAMPSPYLTVTALFCNMPTCLCILQQSKINYCLATADLLLVMRVTFHLAQASKCKFFMCVSILTFWGKFLVQN